MSKYQLMCSCFNCKTQTTTQSLKSHYRKCTVEYICPQCNGPRPKHNKFCSQSCAAAYNNVRRSQASRDKQRASISLYTQNNLDKCNFVRFAPPKYCKFSRCEVCDCVIQNKWNRACTSKDCRSELHSRIILSLGLDNKLNRGRHKKSYLEQSFCDWLDSNNITYECEFKVVNKELNRWYFVDFIFHDKKVIIELDGSQHKNMVDADKVRDTYLRKIGYTVIRITHTEYVKKLRILEVMMALGI